MSRLITYWVELKTRQDSRALNESTVIYVNLGVLTERQQKTCSKCWLGSLENGGIRRVMMMCSIDALVLRFFQNQSIRCDLHLSHSIQAKTISSDNLSA